MDGEITWGTCSSGRVLVVPLSTLLEEEMVGLVLLEQELILLGHHEECRGFLVEQQVFYRSLYDDHHPEICPDVLVDLKVFVFQSILLILHQDCSNMHQNPFVNLMRQLRLQNLAL